MNLEVGNQQLRKWIFARIWPNRAESFCDQVLANLKAGVASRT